jgi:hypothetical protein
MIHQKHRHAAKNINCAPWRMCFRVHTTWIDLCPAPERVTESVQFCVHYIDGFAKPCFYQGHAFPSVLAWLGNSGVGRNATSATSAVSCIHASTLVHNSRFDTTCATCELMCPYRTAIPTTWQQTEEPGANKRLQSHQVQSDVSWEYTTVMSPWPWSSLVTQEQSPNPPWRRCSSGLLEALIYIHEESLKILWKSMGKVATGGHSRRHEICETHWDAAQQCPQAAP